MKKLIGNNHLNFAISRSTLLLAMLWGVNPVSMAMLFLVFISLTYNSVCNLAVLSSIWGTGGGVTNDTHCAAADGEDEAKFDTEALQGITDEGNTWFVLMSEEKAFHYQFCSAVSFLMVSTLDFECNEKLWGVKAI